MTHDDTAHYCADCRFYRNGMQYCAYHGQQRAARSECGEWMHRVVNPDDEE